MNILGFAALILAFLLSIIPIHHVSTKNWNRLASVPTSAIIPVLWDGAIACTAWRLNPTVLITVDHCATDGTGQDIDQVITPDGVLKVIARDHEEDLAAIETPVSHNANLIPSDIPLIVGQSVAAIGYGGGNPTPFYTFGLVSNPRMKIQVNPTFIVDGLVIYGGFVSGMSGGPILNEDGLVVGVVKATGPPIGIYQDIGVGVPQDVFLKFLKTLP